MAAPPNTFRVYDKLAHQERFLTPSEYCASVISQTQPIPKKHTVYFDASRRAVSCTCDDFRNNTLQNDDFMCKHMILYEDHKN